MTLSIEQQFDLKYPERFNPFFGKPIIDSGLFLDGVDDFIVRDEDISIRALRAITSGRVDIFNQERIFLWLDKLHFLAQKNSHSDISEAFFSAMQALCEKTDMRFRRRGYRTSLDREAASECYAFGGNASLISYGLRKVRFISNREAYKHFGEKYGSARPSHLVDFPARLRIFVKNPRDKEFAEEFEGCYEGGATIIKVDDDSWELCFDAYCLNTHHEYLWNLNLWHKIFKAVEPFLSDLLDADIVFTREDQFSD
ncbi:hypothetical protein [uncultured Thiodictyon sp.]|uniref:hypothetical protein n=1 Tax=uncultured Thiodictyon sp. TaxID=1846217 RepID=UPI0025F43590|nr:hypothetical protein [uncultured Thiodictyon sp.]